MTTLKKVEGTTIVEHATGAEVVSTETLAFVVEDGVTADVEVNIGFTKNLGNYQSMRMSVSVRVPCSPTIKHMDDAFEYAYNWADSKLAHILADAEKN